MANRSEQEPKRGSGPDSASFEGERSRGYEAAPQNVDEALARAFRHSKAAAAEVVAAGRALLDAVTLATRGHATDADPLFGPIAQLMEDLEARLATARSDTSPALFSALAEALDAEIARWEERARNDAEARAVLRAFLGVRELLWEFGVRNSGRTGEGEPETKAPGSGRPDEPRPSAKKPDEPRPSAKKRRRVQRVRVEG